MFRILYSYLKPESVRAHPEATVRPWATCHVVGDALSFAQALGHTCVYKAHLSIHHDPPSSLVGVRRYTNEAISSDEEHW